MWGHIKSDHSRPRVILVEDRGLLIGLVTVKDVLRFIVTEKLDHGPHGTSAEGWMEYWRRPGRGRQMLYIERSRGAEG